MTRLDHELHEALGNLIALAERNPEQVPLVKQKAAELLPDDTGTIRRTDRRNK